MLGSSIKKVSLPFAKNHSRLSNVSISLCVRNSKKLFLYLVKSELTITPVGKKSPSKVDDESCYIFSIKCANLIPSYFLVEMQFDTIILAKFSPKIQSPPLKS